MKKLLLVCVALLALCGSAIADVSPTGFGRYLGYWQSTDGAMLFVDAKHSFGTGGPDCKFIHFVVHEDSNLPDKQVFDIDMMCLPEGPDAKPVRVHQTWALRETVDHLPVLVITEKNSVVVYTPRDF